MLSATLIFSFCRGLCRNGDLAEDRDTVLSRVREKAKEMNPEKLSRAVFLYGKYSTQKKFQEMLQHAS